MIRRTAIPALALLMLPLLSQAAEDYSKVKAQLTRSFPQLSTAVVKSSPVPGMLRVEFGEEIGYVTSDGKYLFLGELIEVATHKNLNSAVPTEQGKQVVREIEELGEANMIVMGPKNAKRTMNVFTDVDCPYCARLHQDVPELNRHGVKVRYLLFPRNGLDSNTYKKSVAVWCASDRVKTVGIAKAGGKVDMKTCANPVEKHYRLGEKFGVQGTPTIYLDNGQRLGGYAPVDRMLSVLDIKPEPRAAAN
jgi:thiol:disulfide interchange protein DsbC